MRLAIPACSVACFCLVASGCASRGGLHERFFTLVDDMRSRGYVVTSAYIVDDEAGITLRYDDGRLSIRKTESEVSLLGASLGPRGLSLVFSGPVYLLDPQAGPLDVVVLADEQDPAAVVEDSFELAGSATASREFPRVWLVPISVKQGAIIPTTTIVTLPSNLWIPRAGGVVVGRVRLAQ